MKLDNYRIEKLDGGGMVAYKLHGKRGAVIRLLRNVNTPDLLFAINRTGHPCGEWFTDSRGCLRQVATRPE